MKVIDHPASVTPDAQALIEEARQHRRRRRRRVGTIAIALGLIVVVTIVIAGHTGRSQVTPTVGQRQPTQDVPAPAIPPEMVVWSNHFRIEAISSTTGQVIRTLATNVALFRGTPHPTVSPSGTVYFDDGHAVKNNIPTNQILSVPLSGGPITVVADGQYPVVSPDGRFLAYWVYADFNGREGIVVQDLSTWAAKRWQYSTVGPDINNLSWSPDSESLSFTMLTPTPDKRSLTLGASVLSVSTTPGSLDAAHMISLPHGVAWAGYINATEGIGVAQHWGPTRRNSTFALSVIDVRSGRVVTRLPSVPGQLGVGNTADGPEGTVQVDPSGQYLALVEVGSGNGTLYRWRIGTVPSRISARPVQIATGIFGVAWVPSPGA
jgi:hypothetical protein